MQRKLQMVKGARVPSFRDSPVPLILLQDEPIPSAKPDVKQKLREGGIYALSDGREFVVHAVFRGGYVFYTPENWELFGPYAYGSNADGHMRSHGQPNYWHTEDLIDTGRTAHSRYRRLRDQNRRDVFAGY